MIPGLLAAIAVILLWPAGGIAAGFALIAAQSVFLNYVGFSAGLPLQILLLAFVLAAPLAARIAALILESASLPDPSREILAGAAFTLVLALVFGSDLFVDYLGVVLLSSGKATPVSLFILFVSLVNSLVFCAALTAFTMLTINLLIELPIAWLASAARVRIAAPYAPLRPLILIVGVTLSFHLLIGLFESSLDPRTIEKISSASGGRP